MRGLILFAHGARDPRWALPFEAILQRVKTRYAGPVVLAYLEMMAPDLEAAIATLVEAKCSAVTVVPLFLGEGAHLRRDLPAQVESARQRFPGFAIDTAAAAGGAPGVLDALVAYCLDQGQTEAPRGAQ